MRQFRVLKGENPIFELSMTYGLCAILDRNEINWQLTQKKAYYLLETERDIECNELYFPPLKDKELWNVPSSLGKKEKEGRITSLNDFFRDKANMERTFKYFETGDEKYLKGGKRVGAIFVGTGYYTKGVRGGNQAGAYEISPVEGNLSFLGFIKGSTYISTSSNEINAMLVPQSTHRIHLPFWFTYVDKETGETKKRIKFLDDVPRNFLNAQIYLESLIALRNEKIKENYDGVLFLQVCSTGKKPMADFITKIPILPLSLDTLDNFLMELKRDKIMPKREEIAKATHFLKPKSNDSVRHVFANYILSPNLLNFSEMIQVCVKNNRRLSRDELEELIQLQSQEVQAIYRNQGIKTLGNALYLLMKEKKGYAIQVSLLNCNNSVTLSKAISEMSVINQRQFGRGLIGENELLDVMDLASNNQAARIIADAILAHSNAYVAKKSEGTVRKEAV